MINTVIFRTIVDKTPDLISALQGDLEELYNYVGLSQDLTLSYNAITEKLYANISSSFQTDHLTIRHHCGRLRRQLILEHVLSGQPLDPYYDVLERIQDATNSPAASRSTVDDWNAAIRAAYDHVRLSPWNIDDETRQRTNAREFAIAFAAKRLSNRGFKIALPEDRPILENDAETLLINRIETLLRAIGGINLAANIFRMIGSLYDPQQERYHLVRRVNPLSKGANPQIPFGYLLLLAAKYPFSKPDTHHLDANFSELVSLSKDFGALFDVQTYNTFELMFNNHDTLIPFLRELALHDALFTIPQMRPLDAIKIITGTLLGLDWEHEYNGSWKLSEAVKIASDLLALGRTQRGPRAFTAREVVPRCSGVRPGKVYDILEDLFSHPPPGANQDYSVPTDTPGPDFYFRPLLSDGRANHWLLDASVSAPAFIEALLTPLRSAHPNLDEMLGNAIAHFLRSELAAHGVTVIGGKYWANGAEGECDIVVETSDVILFIEVKKKPLTRKARSGSDVAILLDLAASLLDAQLQAGWHEVRIRKLGHLNLEDDEGRKTRLELRGRQVERVAVTFLDFGSFQDRVVLQQFLENNLIANYKPVDPSMEVKFATLNEKLKELRAQVSELGSQNKGEYRLPFFHCWFLSIPQLLVLLDSVKSNDDLKTALWNTRHMSMGSLDFYFEHAQALRIRKVARQ